MSKQKQREALFSNMKTGCNSHNQMTVYPGEEFPPGRYQGELTDTIKVDISSIPDYVREDLVATILNDIREFIRKPGGKEILAAKIAAIKKAESLRN